MLSNEDIRRRIAAGELQFTPFRDDMIRGCGVTLHLGTTLMKPVVGTVIDVCRPGSPPYETVTISRTEPYPLQPHEFLLGHTLQLVTVGASLGFLIEGRSTLARVGLTIVQTAMMVYPGHENRAVTLELANHGPNPILLYAGMKIARAAILALDTPSTEYYDTSGKYRNQTSVGPPIFEDELW